jgi:hypothetical protein
VGIEEGVVIEGDDGCDEDIDEDGDDVSALCHVVHVEWYPEDPTVCGCDQAAYLTRNHFECAARRVCLEDNDKIAFTKVMSVYCGCGCGGRPLLRFGVAEGPWAPGRGR